MPTSRMNTNTKRRRRKSIFNTKSIEASKEVSSLPEFFVMMQYETDSPSAYCTVISRCRRELAPGLNTMAVTVTKEGTYKLMYDPTFNDMVRVRENWETVRMILIHEFIHLQDEHTTRSISKWMSCTTDEQKEEFKKINPYAIDFACNSTAIKWGLYSEDQLLSGKPHVETSPGVPMRDAKDRIIGKWRGILPTEEPWNLPANLSYERYYSILQGILKDKPPKEWGSGDPDSNEDSQDSQGGSSGSTEPQENSNESAQSRIQKCKDILNKPKGEKKFVHIEDLNLEELTEEELEAIKQESERISQELSGELLSELKSRGLGSSALARDIESRLIPPQIPWEQFLRSFVRTASLKKSKRKSIRHQNKRKEDNGIWSPFPGKQKDKKVKLLVAFDTSGSVSDAEFIEMRNEILALHHLLSDVTVIYCDTEIAHIEKLTANSKLPPKRFGCGGTSFDPPFAWAIEKKFNPDIIIYGTDGECTLPPENLRINKPLLWLVSSRGSLPGAFYSNEPMSPGKLYNLEYGNAIKLNPLG